MKFVFKALVSIYSVFLNIKSYHDSIVTVAKYPKLRNKDNSDVTKFVGAKMKLGLLE